MKTIVRYVFLPVMVVLAFAYAVQAQDAEMDIGNSVIVMPNGGEIIEGGQFDGIKSFASIQEALNSARIQDGSQIIVLPGVYTESNISLRTSTSDDVVLRSYAGPDVTVIQQSSGSTQLFSTLNNSFVVNGFTITGEASGLHNVRNFKNCVFVNVGTIVDLVSSRSRPYEFTNNIFVSYIEPVFEINLRSIILESSSHIRVENGTGTVIRNAEFYNITFQNNVVYNNLDSFFAFTGEYKISQTDIDGNRTTVDVETLVFPGEGEGGSLGFDFRNNVFFSNTGSVIVTPGLSGGIVLPDDTGFNPSTMFESEYGNLQVDPQFLDPSNGDFRLLSSSPLRDAGIPSIQAQDPDGTRNDIGAYGGPFAINFFEATIGAPIIRQLQVTPGSIIQGEPFTIRAVGAVN